MESESNLELELLTAVKNDDKDEVKSLLKRAEKSFNRAMKLRKSMPFLYENEDSNDDEIYSEIDFNTWTEAVQISKRKSFSDILDLLFNKCDFIIQSQDNREGDSILHQYFCKKETCYRDYLGLTEKLLESGKANVNAINFEGKTILHSMLDSDHLGSNSPCLGNHNALFDDAIALLLRYGLNVNHRDIKGRTSLMMASHYGCAAAMLTILIWAKETDTRLDLDAQDKYGRTALIEAVLRSNSVTVEILLNAGASVNLSDHRGFTDLHHALCKAFISPMWSISQGFGWVEFGDFPRNLEELRKIKELNSILSKYNRKYENSEKNESELYEDRIKIVELLLEREDVDVNALQFNGFSPLDISEASIKTIPFTIMDYLIKKGARLNVYQQTTNQLSGKFQFDVGCVNFVLHRFAIGDNVENRLKSLEILKEGFSHLSSAVQSEMLSSKDVKGRTPLHSAVIACEEDYCVLVDFHSCDANEEEIKIVRIMISLGCGVNETDIYGRTPLHYACCKRVMELLLCHGADATTKDENGISATQIVKKWPDNLDLYSSSSEENYDNASNRFRVSSSSLSSFSSSPDNSGHEHLSPDAIIESLWKGGKYACRHPASKEVKEEVKQIINDIATEIKEQDPRFETKVMLVGSSHQGTRLNEPDEFDFILILTKFSQLCEVYSSPDRPTGYVRLRKKGTENEEEKATEGVNEKHFDSFFAIDNILITEKVHRHFIMILETVVKYIESKRNYSWKWHFCLDREERSGDDLKIAATWEMRNMKFDDNGGFVTGISIDIVPCIHIGGYWPDEAISNVSEDIKSFGCILVFDRPQRKFPRFPQDLIPYSESCVRISFSPAESEMLRRSCDNARQAFMIGRKCLGHGECETSYVLKNSLLYCIEAFPQSSDIFSKMNGKMWLEGLMKCHRDFVLQGFCPTYLIPTFYLPITKGDASFLEVCFKSDNSYRVISKNSSIKRFPIPSFGTNFDRERLIKDLGEAAIKRLKVHFPDKLRSWFSEGISSLRGRFRHRRRHQKTKESSDSDENDDENYQFPLSLEDDDVGSDARAPKCKFIDLAESTIKECEENFSGMVEFDRRRNDCDDVYDADNDDDADNDAKATDISLADQKEIIYKR